MSPDVDSCGRDGEGKDHAGGPQYLHEVWYIKLGKVSRGNGGRGTLDCCGKDGS